MEAVMKEIRRGVWFVAIGFILFVGAQLIAGEPVKLNTKGFKEGCICTGQSYAGGSVYESVLVVAITPEGSDYWVFYPEHLEDRHRRHDGTLMALRMPTEQFLPRGKFRAGKMGRLRCPESLWGNDTQMANAER